MLKVLYNVILLQISLFRDWGTFLILKMFGAGAFKKNDRKISHLSPLNLPAVLLNKRSINLKLFPTTKNGELNFDPSSPSQMNAVRFKLFNPLSFN